LKKGNASTTAMGVGYRLDSLSEVRETQGVKMKPNLEKVTLVGITSIDFENTYYAMWRSKAQGNFGAIKLISPTKPDDLPKWIKHETTFDSILDSIDSYSHYCLYNLWRHIDTDFCLIVHADGYIINKRAWDSSFLEWDYIGAPWRVTSDAYIDPFGKNQRVGNGGFSLRSQRILTTPNRVDIPWEVNTGDFYKHMNAMNYAEDGNICVHNRHLFEADGVRFAPLETALSFSVEQKVTEFDNRKTFGFHKTLPSKRIYIKDKFHRYVFKLIRRIN